MDNKIRVYELAKQLKSTSKKILEMLHLSGRHGRHSEHVDRNVTLGSSKLADNADEEKTTAACPPGSRR